MTSNSLVERIHDTHNCQLEGILTLTKGNSKVKFHWKLQCWDSSAIWFGPMTSNRHVERIHDTQDSQLDRISTIREEIQNWHMEQIPDFHESQLLTLPEEIQNQQMGRIHDTHDSWLERIVTWQMEIQFHQCWDSSVGRMTSNWHMERIPDTHDSRLHEGKFNSIKLHQCWDFSAAFRYCWMTSNRLMERKRETYDRQHVLMPNDFALLCTWNSL